ncbi:uncharacterized protein LOC134947590 [Pseudophryne corroboree]|uniref:uncharacterized protein LOC134947590 n=1 Tax=Pseudophryne corroboree TaxID=495146 RepID=UPI003081A11C
MASTFLHYSSSLVNIDTDFGSSWAGDEEPSYELDGSTCLPCKVHMAPVSGDRLDSESQRTVITESMSVTASDEEKLQLLNKNTELRRLNAELMKLNQQWDEIYHSATQKMHLTVRELQDEVQSLRHHSDKLSLKLEHEQNKKEFYETSLFQEIKRNQKLQEHVRHLEGILHYNTLSQCGAHNTTEIKSQSDRGRSNLPGVMTQKVSLQGSSNHSAENVAPASNHQVQDRGHHLPMKTSRSHQNKQDANAVTTEQDINQLKEQLQALKCQTEIYAADYKTEHTDRQRMKTENDKLRRKEREMREQMLILEEQLKVYEDDFRKERCDKQVLQRLLKSRNSTREPLLVHRCNNATPQKGLFVDTEVHSRSGSRRQQSGTDVENQTENRHIGF